MRADMAKVIVERPRYGSWKPSRKKGYRKFLQSMPVADLPRQEPLLGRWHGMSRALSENLQPLHRFLRSQIGRPWNHVHKELCEYVSFENAVQKHVLAHLESFVSLHVEEVGRQLFSGHGWPPRRALRPGEMYVCPHTGLLKEVKRRHHREPATRLHNGPKSLYLLKDGIWWDVGVRKLADAKPDHWDPWLEQIVDHLGHNLCRKTYGGLLYATTKRPMSPTEAKQRLKACRQKQERAPKNRQAVSQR